VDDTPAPHPAVARLRAELAAALAAVTTIDRVSAANRHRVIADIRASLPDVVSRAARDVDARSVLVEIDRYAGIDIAQAALWDSIVADATAAATAVC